MHDERASQRTVTRGMTPRQYSVFLLIGACAFPAPAPPRPAPTPSVAIETASETADDMVRQTNLQRRALGLAELRRSPALMQAAQLHADQMASAQRMAHDLPGARYPTLRHRLEGVAYSWRAIAENVAEGYTDASSVVTGWMKSTGHRENIVSTQFNEMGAGMATSTSGRRFWVQVFSTPR